MKNWKNRLGILFMVGSILGSLAIPDGGVSGIRHLLLFAIGAIFFVIEWES